MLASEIASVPRHIENYIIPVEDLRGLDTSVQNQILQLQLELLRDIRRTVQPPESSPSSFRMHHDCDSALQMRPVHSGEGPEQKELRGKGTITDAQRAGTGRLAQRCRSALLSNFSCKPFKKVRYCNGSNCRPTSSLMIVACNHAS